MTVTANLYCNLAAWSSGTKTAGNCVSASGNAYRCISGGTSATTPSGTSTSPTSFGSDTSTWVWLSAITFSGTDVTTMFSAAVAGSVGVGGLTGTITQPIIWQLWNVNSAAQTSTTNASILTLSGHSLTPTNNLTITCAPGESFRDHGSNNALAVNVANGVLITFPNISGAGKNWIIVDDPNVTFDGIQFLDPAPTVSDSTHINTNTNNCTIRNCILDGATQSGGAFIIDIGSTTATGTLITNTLIINRAAASAVNQYPCLKDPASSTTSITCVNCTFIAINALTATAAIIGDSSTTTSWKIRNCVSINYALGTAGIMYVGSTPASGLTDHCGTDAAAVSSSGGTDSGGELVSQTIANMFVSSTTDFRLKSGSPFINAGVTDTTNIPTADDIFRTPRPQGSAWDMGAFEFPASAATLSETAATSDTWSQTTASAATLSETAATSDTLSGVSSVIPISETAATSDNWTETTASAATLSETAATSDALSPKPTSSLAETSATSDTWSTTATATLSQTAVTSDAWSQTSASTRTLSETAATSDSYTEALVAAPWSTSNCAYSAASFSAGNFGTDSGGSVYGITSAVFFGFPTNMNPASGSVVIDAGATDTTDIPSAVDAFGNSRPQGSSWDIGAVELLVTARTITRDFPTLFEFQRTVPNENLISAIEWKQAFTTDAKIPAEWMSISSSFGITQMSIEFGQNIPAVSATVPIEWQLSTGLLSTRDMIVPIEWGVGRQRDFAVPTELRQSLAIDALTPIEWSSTPLTVTTDVNIALEILQSTLRDSFTPTEWGASVVRPVIYDMPIAVEWLSRSIVAVNQPFALEILRSSTTDATSPGEWGGGTTANFVVPLEARSAYQATIIAPIESKISLLRDGVLPIEWGALNSFNADAVVTIEWQHTQARDIAVPVTWLGAQFGPLNVPIALEWNAALAVDITGPAEWRASLQANSAGPIEWVQTFASVTKTVLIEFGQGFVADIQVPVAALANIRRDAIAPLEWNNALALQFNINIPVEFAASVQGIKTSAIEWSTLRIVDSAMPLASGASLAADNRLSLEVLRGIQANATVPVEPSSGVAGTAAIPLEFGHLTLTTTADFKMPLEINSLVIGGIVVPIEVRGVRLTIGARLEPDAWERQADFLNKTRT